VRQVEGRGQQLRKKLGELLVEAGLVSRKQVQEALEEQQKTGKRLGQILVERGSVSKDELGRVLQTQTGFPYVSLTAQPLDREVVGLVPESLVRRFRAIPIAREGNELIIAMADPTDLMAIDELSAASGFRIRPVLTTESDLEWAIAQLFDVRRQVEEAVEAAEGEDLGRTVREEVVLTIEEDRDTSPVIRMVNSIIRGAISAGATDIHFEPQPGGLRVRYRIDGMLYDKASIPQTMQAAVVSRIKVMAGLNIAERVKPQDGRISLRVDGAEYDVRVATIGCAYGERVVLRLLDKHRILLGLDRLGLLPDQQELVMTLIRKPYGMILVTGPTGSGKTTSLYAFLNYINEPTKNIITIEDPVEYHLEGITQIPVRPRMGITFANGLRSIVRQDPNVIMVGEIRDAETAQIAVQAALTGHLVLTTLHTNDAAGAMLRLIDMGIEPYFITSAVIATLGQRLVRRICTGCREAYTAPVEVLRELELPEDRPVTLYRGVGCPACDYTAYKGRTAVFEILVMSDPIRELVLRRRPSSEIRDLARRLGMKTMRECAIHKALEGITSVEEVRRVIFLETDAVV